MKAYFNNIVILTVILLHFVSLPAQSLMTRKGMYLYVGIENWIDIYPAQSSEQYRVSFPGCKVKVENGCYYVTPPASLMENGVIALISQKDNSKKEPIQQRFFVKEVPNPVAIWGACFKSTISKEEFLKYNRLLAAMNDDFPYDILWKISCYKIVLVTDDGVQPALICDGSEPLSESVMAHIKSTKKLKFIIITDIKAKSVVGERYLKDVVYKLH